MMTTEQKNFTKLQKCLGTKFEIFQKSLNIYTLVSLVLRAPECSLFKDKGFVPSALRASVTENNNFRAKIEM